MNRLLDAIADNAPTVAEHRSGLLADQRARGVSMHLPHRCRVWGLGQRPILAATLARVLIASSISDSRKTETCSLSQAGRR